MNNQLYKIGFDATVLKKLKHLTNLADSSLGLSGVLKPIAGGAGLGGVAGGLGGLVSGEWGDKLQSGLHGAGLGALTGGVVSGIGSGLHRSKMKKLLGSDLKNILFEAPTYTSDLAETAAHHLKNLDLEKKIIDSLSKANRAAAIRAPLSGFFAGGLTGESRREDPRALRLLGNSSGAYKTVKGLFDE